MIPCPIVPDATTDWQKMKQLSIDQSVTLSRFCPGFLDGNGDAQGTRHKRDIVFPLQELAGSIFGIEYLPSKLYQPVACYTAAQRL